MNSPTREKIFAAPEEHYDEDALSALSDVTLVMDNPRYALSAKADIRSHRASQSVPTYVFSSTKLSKGNVEMKGLS